MAKRNTNYNQQDSNDTPRGRWVKTEDGGEVWVTENGGGEDMSAADWYEMQKHIDQIERYLRS